MSAAGSSAIACVFIDLLPYGQHIPGGKALDHDGA
jgi:hypothetical protein